jgi:hypothetical protein
VLYKLISIHSHLRILSNHFEEAFTEAKAKGDKREPWQFVLPLATNPQYVHFTTDEMTLVLSLKEDDIFNAMLSLDESHNSIIDLSTLIRQKREQLTDMMPVGSASLTKEQSAKLRPHMVVLNQLIEAIRSYSATDANASQETLFAAHSALSSKLGFRYKLSLVEPGAAEKTPAKSN